MAGQTLLSEATPHTTTCQTIAIDGVSAINGLTIESASNGVGRLSQSAPFPERTQHTCRAVLEDADAKTLLVPRRWLPTQARGGMSSSRRSRRLTRIPCRFIWTWIPQREMSGGKG